MRKRLSGFLLMIMLFVSACSSMVMPAYASHLTFAGGSGGITISGDNLPSMTNSDLSTLVEKPLTKYKSIATAVAAFGTVTSFLAMVFCFTRLSVAGDNEQARKRAIMGIMTSGAGVALLGGATVVIGFFWNLLL